jgi:hypothetical protein
VPLVLTTRRLTWLDVRFLDARIKEQTVINRPRFGMVPGWVFYCPKTNPAGENPFSLAGVVPPPARGNPQKEEKAC